MVQEAPFQLTKEAKAQLSALLQKLKRTSGRDATPGLIWIDSSLNEGRVESGIGVGFYYDRRQIENDIVVVGDMEILLAAAEEDRDRFVGKTIDFNNGRFIFLGEAG